MKEINRIAELEQENAELKAELHKYENMAAKGLEEFKDVGGCWGCGLQLQLNQDIEDIKQLKAENKRLKAENKEVCERMATVTYRATGGRLSYSNYTLDAIENAFYDQLEILADQKSEELKQENAELKKKVEELDKMTGIFSARLCEKYRKTLQEIKDIAENCYDPADKENDGFYTILQIITKAEVGE